MKIALLAFALGTFAAPAVAGNFCAVTASGSNCSFPDLSSCYQHLRGVGGQCVANPQVLPQPQQSAPSARPTFDAARAMRHTSVADSFAQGQQQARSAAIERERIRQLQAQRQTLEQPRAETNDGYWVMYRCPDQRGLMQYSGVPAPGCIVESVTAY